MPKTNPDIIMHLPQAQLQAAQARLTDYLLQAQYAFMQSFSGDADTIVDIFPPSIPEGVQLVLCPAESGVSVEYAQDQAISAAEPSAQMAALVQRLVAVCTAHKGT